MFSFQYQNNQRKNRIITGMANNSDNVPAPDTLIDDFKVRLRILRIFAAKDNACNLLDSLNHTTDKLSFELPTDEPNTINPSINRSIDQSSNQSSNQSIHQSLDISINQSIERAMHFQELKKMWPNSLCVGENLDFGAFPAQIVECELSTRLTFGVNAAYRTHNKRQSILGISTTSAGWKISRKKFIKRGFFFVFVPATRTSSANCSPSGISLYFAMKSVNDVVTLNLWTYGFTPVFLMAFCCSTRILKYSWKEKGLQSAKIRGKNDIRHTLGSEVSTAFSPLDNPPTAPACEAKLAAFLTSSTFAAFFSFSSAFCWALAWRFCSLKRI